MQSNEHFFFTFAKRKYQHLRVSAFIASKMCNNGCSRNIIVEGKKVELIEFLG